MKLTKFEKKNYVLKNKYDLIILSKTKELEKKLSKKDKEILKLIKTQLRQDWKTSPINYLNKLSNK